jgi:hypothetical protein
MWQNIGGEVWAAPWVRITHSGDYNFSGRFVRMLEASNIKKALDAANAAKNKNSTENSTEVEKKEPSTK